MSTLFILIFAFVVIVLFAILAASSKAKSNANAKKTLEDLAKSSNLVITKSILGINSSYLFTIDNSNKKIGYFTLQNSIVVPFDSILSVELLEDENIVFKKSLGRTVGGAIIGGALTGGVGAIVGGLSGGSKQSNMVSSVIVKILIKDVSNPSINVFAFNSKNMTTERKSSIKKEGAMESYIYKKGLQDAQDIVDSLKVIIDVPDKIVSHDLNNDDIIYDIIRLKSEGKILEAVKLCVDAKKLSLSEANEYVKNI